MNRCAKRRIITRRRATCAFFICHGVRYVI
nr:MAG TPA: hypothetical protein [Caudoviricetes sp.]DAW52880.1 MAG TPA: hypothetical protein [Bacteriophage sp.]